MDQPQFFALYRELQSYVGWTDADMHRLTAVAPAVAPYFRALIDDFYEEIDRHAEARKVITGGAAQVARLKGTLLEWIAELFSGRYDERYVSRRWRVGWRHVEIGLAQVYTNVALSRLRTGLSRAIQESWTGDPVEMKETVRSLNKLLDLDLAIIEDAYQAEYLARQQRIERLATLGQVAGGVAHELRNPLNVVKTSIYYLLHARNATPEKTAEHLGRIERNVDRADGVITALSRFAKMPVPNLRPVSLERLVREALEADPPGQDIETAAEVAPGLPDVLADEDQLRIVLGNLIRNACDAMPRGGRLTIRGQPHAGRVALAVADTGVGIPPEHLGRIMEPLYSTKARGLGLGLAIARAIVEKNGGFLRVASEPGKGSTFTVFLQTDGKEKRSS
jgi:signal transduction histidine kinase